MTMGQQGTILDNQSKYLLTHPMLADPTFQRRGIVEGFFGPPWSMFHRATLFEFGQKRGMNTYLYAPREAAKHRVDFVYGFHPGKGLHFGAAEPLGWLLNKAKGLYDAGVRTFAVLFDDIPSHLEFPEDKKSFDGSLAKAEGLWLKKILDEQPNSWNEVEWWICPSYYTEDPLLARTFGAFEPSFLETLGEHMPETVSCFWTGPSVVSKSISLAHMRKVKKALRHPIILWDNYPVNDLTMSMEMHLSPLTGRDPRLPEQVYGYMNNPLLQEALSFIPLATCFDYAANPRGYNPEASWEAGVTERFGPTALPQWRVIRKFCEQINGLKDKKKPLALTSKKIRSELEGAYRYLLENRRERWVEEFQPWLDLMKKNLGLDT
jgi:hyaluronoglucosaminidase